MALFVEHIGKRKNVSVIKANNHKYSSQSTVTALAKIMLKIYNIIVKDD